jgi:hypothetical protein
MNNILQKSIKKYIKSSIIKNYQKENFIEDENINDESEELAKRNWIFFTGISVFYVIFIFVLSLVIKK